MEGGAPRKIRTECTFIRFILAPFQAFRFLFEPSSDSLINAKLPTQSNSSGHPNLISHFIHFNMVNNRGINNKYLCNPNWTRIKRDINSNTTSSIPVH